MKYNLHKAATAMVLSAVALSGCSIGAKLEHDRAAMHEMKNVAVVMYSVPPSINYQDDPRKSGEKGLLQSLSEAVTSDNGGQAATLARDAFIENLNNSENGMSFRLMTTEQMMSNNKFVEINDKYIKQIADKKAAAAEEQNSTSLGQALSFMNSLAAASGEQVGSEGAAPKGGVSFGLATNWGGTTSALVNAEGEMNYVKEAIAALGVDGALIINDPGMSFSCDACIAGTGTASTGSAFLATLVDSSGTQVLSMRQWFALSDGNAAILSYAVNPLEHDELFKGHGKKMGRVFVDYYNDQTKK